jgi:hypothetical protein
MMKKRAAPITIVQSGAFKNAEEVIFQALQSFQPTGSI